MHWEHSKTARSSEGFLKFFNIVTFKFCYVAAASYLKPLSKVVLIQFDILTIAVRPTVVIAIG